MAAACGPVEIMRENQVKQITVEADMAGGDMPQSMAAAAIGGLGMEILVALFLMPCMYVA